jgi:hypothetical protein
MRTIVGTSVAAAVLTLLSANAGAQHSDAGHSLEADQHDERVEGVQAVDLHALVQYVESLQQPFTAQIEGRIKRLN